MQNQSRKYTKNRNGYQKKVSEKKTEKVNEKDTEVKEMVSAVNKNKVDSQFPKKDNRPNYNNQSNRFKAGYSSKNNSYKDHSKKYNDDVNNKNINYNKKPCKFDTIETIQNSICDAVKESTREDFYFRWNINKDKIESNVLSGTIKISLKSDQTKFKYIGFIIVQDIAHNNHVTIFDDNIKESSDGDKLARVNVLYTSTSKTPSEKLKSYTKNIIKSVEDIVSKM